MKSAFSYWSSGETEPLLAVVTNLMQVPWIDQMIKILIVLQTWAEQIQESRGRARGG
jgi:hypothetical protein